MDHVSAQTRKKCFAASLNNRAVMQGPKIDKNDLRKRFDFDQNEKIIKGQMDCYNKACAVNPDCYEAQFNRLLLSWK